VLARHSLGHSVTEGLWGSEHGKIDPCLGLRSGKVAWTKPRHQTLKKIQCIRLLELSFERDALSSRKKGFAFARALLRQWWLLLLPVLGLISTAVTFVEPLWPQFRLPRFLVFGLSFVLLLAAFYRVFSAQYDLLTSEKAENDSLKRETDRLTNKCDSLQNEFTNAQDKDLRLEQEVERLRIRPYDKQKLTSAQATVATLSMVERDLLRFLSLNGECRTDVIFQSRSRPELPFDINSLRKAWVCGLAICNDNDSSETGFSRYSISPSWQDVLRDLLFPRVEASDQPPFFKGIE
jgi:hypothetical protein